jgi:hypothetical protein
MKTKTTPKSSHVKRLMRQSATERALGFRSIKAAQHYMRYDNWGAAASSMAGAASRFRTASGLLEEAAKGCIMDF